MSRRPPRSTLTATLVPYTTLCRSGGGDMISSVTFEKSEWAPLPAKFEAGTPAIVPAIGLGAAIDYVNGIGLEAIAAHERDLLTYATQRLSPIEGPRIVGPAPAKASGISLPLDYPTPHNIGTVLNRVRDPPRDGQARNCSGQGS